MRRDEDKIRIEVSRRQLMGLACVLAGFLGYQGSIALADGDPATSSVLDADLVVPYDGYLQLDGSDINDTVRLRFELFEAPTGGTPEWSEEQTVTLHNGQMSVALGSVERLNEVVLDAERLWLGVMILEDDGAGGTVEVALAGRQAIEPAPYAAWSAHSADFEVARDLSVAGAATVGGGLDVGGAASFGGDTLSLGVGASGGLGDGGRALAQVATDTLATNPAGEFAGGILLDGPSVDTPGDAHPRGPITPGDNSSPAPPNRHGLAPAP